MKENYENIYKKICEIYGDEPLVFIKFFEKIEYAQDFLSGKLYCNTPKYYQELENETSKKGQGDKYEGTLKLDNVIGSISMTNNDTGEKTSVDAEPLILRCADLDSSTPIFCFMGLKVSDFDIYSIADDNIVLKIKDGEYLKKIIEDCGKYFVPFNVDDFKTRYDDFLVSSPLLSKDNKSYLSEVIYGDTTINKIIDISNNPIEIYKYKDRFFEYQKEYRIVIDMMIPDNNIINIRESIIELNGEECYGPIISSKTINELKITVQRYKKKERIF